MLVGMKTWSGNRIEKIKKSAQIGDFTEVMIEPDKDFTKLKKIKTKWIVHCPHAKFGFNPADKKTWTKSKHLLERSQKAATFLKANKIVVHPGYAQIYGSKKVVGTTATAIEFFQMFKDKRILLENLSRVHRDNKGIAHPMFNTPEGMKEILRKNDYEFCLDVAHAWVVAVNLGKDPKKMIRQFLRLKPTHFHVLDSRKLKIDVHAHLGEGLMDVYFFRDVIQKYLKKNKATVILETLYNIDKNKKEIAFMKSTQSK